MPTLVSTVASTSVSLRLRAAVATTATVACLASMAALAGPAGAAEGPDRYEKAQVGLTYTVYRPSVTGGLPRTSFALNGCAPGRDEMINVDYGDQSRGRWIGLTESQRGCVDGPDGVGPAATFAVRGATATVLGDCPGERSTCASATRAGVKRGAYTTVTLPSGGDGLSPTLVEVYTAGFTLAQVKAVVRGLAPVQ